MAVTCIKDNELRYRSHISMGIYRNSERGMEGKGKERITRKVPYEVEHVDEGT